MRIALDLGGGPIHPILAGAIPAARTGEHELRLFGPEEAIRAELTSLGYSENAQVVISDAPGVVGADEDAQAACRDRNDVSVINAAACAAAGEADALITVASERIAVAAALWHFKRLPGVLKPAAACLIPAANRPTLFLDVGSAGNCKPWHLLQFGLMGSIYAKTVLEIHDPSVYLLSSSSPASEQSELVREALPLLKYAGVRFEGAIDARVISQGKADVVVTDGDTGNILIGALRGLADHYSIMLESNVGKGPVRRLGAALVRSALTEAAVSGFGIAAGGIALLGVAGSTVLCGGTPEEAAAAIETVAKLEGSEFQKRLHKRLSDVKTGMETKGAIE
ncbi:MAG: hypothetical protein COB53_01040 [Elusimicrobia bacterium]|nr:MAG: hypothetical protein COB53_01040 [Elusimicrobiota bacterium]